MAKKLTARQTEMLILLAKGYTQREIANELVLTRVGVQNHLRRIYDRLDAQNAAHAVYIALSLGLIPPGDFSMEET